MTHRTQHMIDITKHPFDSSSILNWALDIWEENPSAKLLVITHKGDGPDLDNRLRVKLSIVRGQLRHQLGQQGKRFSLLSRVIPWAHDSKGEKPCDALYLTYRVRATHVAADALDAIFVEKLQ